MKKLIFLLFTMGYLSPSLVFAGAGKTGLDFLSLGNGARAIGMGEAQTAVADGANSIYWNPAGLGLTPFPEITLTHAELFQDAFEQYAGLALPVKKGKNGTFGFSATRFAIKNIEARDAQSTLSDGTMEQNDLSLQLSYGVRVGGSRFRSSDPHGRPRLSDGGLYLGTGVKRISEKLAGVSASAFAYDVGAQYRPGETLANAMGEWARRMSVGVSALNLGKGVTFDKDETPLPQTTRIGAAYTHFLWGDALTLSSDYELAKKGQSRWLGGAEFWVKNMLALRAGYVQGQDVGDAVRFGAGFRFQTLQLDYALARFGSSLGSTHRFTLTLRFGEGALQATTGLKSDLLNFYLSKAQEELSIGSYHDAVIDANHALEVDPRNSRALQILFDAGEKMKVPSPLPEPKIEPTSPSTSNPDLPKNSPAQPAP